MEHPVLTTVVIHDVSVDIVTDISGAVLKYMPRLGQKNRGTSIKNTLHT